MVLEKSTINFIDHEKQLVSKIVYEHVKDIYSSSNPERPNDGFEHYCKKDITSYKHMVIFFNYDNKMTKQTKIDIDKAMQKAKAMIKKAYVNFEYLIFDNYSGCMDFSEMYGRMSFGLISGRPDESKGEKPYPDVFKEEWYVKKYGDFDEEYNNKRKKEFFEQNRINKRKTDKIKNDVLNITKEFPNVEVNILQTHIVEDGALSWKKRYPRYVINVRNVTVEDVSLLHLKLISLKMDEVYNILGVYVYPMVVSSADEGIHKHEFREIFDSRETEK